MNFGPWSRDEQLALRALYFQSRAYSRQAGAAGGLTYPEMSQRMTQMNQREGWPQRNYQPGTLALYLNNHPEMRLPPQTLDPAPRRSNYDAEVLRRFQLRF